MPILHNAIKKLRQDKKRTISNSKLKDKYKKLIKAAKTKKTKKSISTAFSSIDKAAKQNIIHPNKAGRLKSSIARAISSPSQHA